MVKVKPTVNKNRVTATSKNNQVAVTVNSDSVKYYSNLAKEWACKLQTTVDGAEYSAKYYMEKTAQKAADSKSELELICSQNVDDMYDIKNAAISALQQEGDGILDEVNEKYNDIVDIQSELSAISFDLANKDLSNITNQAINRIVNYAQTKQIGEIVTSTLPLSDAGLHLLDGALISGSGIYADFVDYIAELYNADPTANYFAQSQGEIAWVQPIATGSTTAITGGDMVITSSSSYSNYDAWKAMDGVYSGTTATTGWGINNTSANQWWQLKLPYQIRITGLKGYQRYDTTPANANTIGRFYTSSDMTTPIGDTYTNASGINWNAVEVSGIPEEGIVTDTIYFQKTGGGNYGGLGELVITATVVGSGKTAEQVWQQSVADYGVCGKFVYDSTNNTVRLPKLGNQLYSTSLTTAPVSIFGDGYALGLKANGSNDFGMGFYTGSTRVTMGTGWTDKPLGTTSTIGNIPADNQPVGLNPNPNLSHIKGIADLSEAAPVDVFYYIVVATSVKTDIQVDIDEIATDLNGKADVDGSNMVNSVKKFDGQWINDWITALSGVTVDTTETEIDLSSYLPNDGYSYTVTTVVQGQPAQANANILIHTDLVGEYSFRGVVANVVTAITYDIPVNSSRKLYIRTFSSSWNSTNIYLKGYRRIGTNS
ncbi:hypothetical protein IJ750_04560 [bacterium]|nr:hypothetical protein [bacterium]